MTEKRASPALIYGVLATLILSIAATMIWVAKASEPSPKAALAGPPAPMPAPPPRREAPLAKAGPARVAERPAPEKPDPLSEAKSDEGSLLHAASGLALDLDSPEDAGSEAEAPRSTPIAAAPTPIAPASPATVAIGPVDVSPQRPMWSEALTITATGGGFVRWGVNNWKRPPDALKTANTTEVDGVFETPLDQDDRLVLGPFALPRDIQEINFVVRRPDGRWGQNQTVRLEAKSVWSDRARLGQGPVTIFSRRGGLVHFGINGWKDIQDRPLNGPDAEGLFRAELGDFGDEAASLEFAIKHEDGSWDNNGGLDYHLAR